MTRNADATIFIPSEDEWYKAAYYDPTTSSYFQYPTSSNTAPSNAYVDAGNNANFYDVDNGGSGYTTSSPHLTAVGHFATSPSPYGTFDQGGNVWDWNDSYIMDFLRGVRGGAFGELSSDLQSSSRFLSDPKVGGSGTGFRVASVPEPSTCVLAAFGVLLCVAYSRRGRPRAL